MLAFTDDPEPHRKAILALRPSPDDEPAVLPPPTITATTTVAESGTVVDVVQVERTEAELTSTQDQVTKDLDDAGIEVIGTSTRPTLNRVAIDVALADDDTRRAIAEVAPPEAICVDGPIDTPPTIDPEDPPNLIPEAGDDPLVTCDSIPFPMSALTGPTGAEQADEPYAEALREALAGASAAMLPADGWRLLAHDDEQALYANGEPPTMIFAVITHEGDRWIYAGMSSGSCEPRAPLPAGLGAADWTLDPDQPPPAAADTELHLLVTEQACTGATPIGDRLVGPQVVENEESVLIAVAVEPLDAGMHTCPGNPPLPVTVQLSGPLGSRTIADGTYIPPRTVEPADAPCMASRCVQSGG